MSRPIQAHLLSSGVLVHSMGAERCIDAKHTALEAPRPDHAIAALLTATSDELRGTNAVLERCLRDGRCVVSERADARALL
eukprot:143837-Pleurochrysis_carterae.AAC.1